MSDDHDRLVLLEAQTSGHEKECSIRYAALEKNGDELNKTIHDGFELMHSRMSSLRRDATRAVLWFLVMLLAGAATVIGYLLTHPVPMIPPA